MKRPLEAVVVGASAGGVEALSALLAALPADHRVPVVAVVHLPSGEPSVLAEVLSRRCPFAVREVEDKQPLVEGAVFVAPPDYHVLIEDDRTLALSMDDPVHFSRPSIDVLFESAADALGGRVAGVILTGANRDGAAGLRAIADAGGVAIVQDPGSAAAAEMPRAALRATTPELVAPPQEIGRYLAGFEAIRGETT